MPNNINEEIKQLEDKLKKLKSEQKHSGGASSQKNSLLVPGSIIFAGLLIALAVFFAGGGFSGSGQERVAANSNNGNNQPAQEESSGDVENMRPVSEEDHIRGDADAPVKIVEYSDLSCPFCEKFHPTLKKALNEYDGEVAWVYRHFPLASLHQHAQAQAEATECVAEAGGEDAFWAFIDHLFENQVVQDSELASAASAVGVSESKVQNCLDSGKFESKVKSDLENATDSGGRGTPFTVVVAPNGKKFTVNGAQPYSSLKSTIDLALEEK